MGKIDFSMDYCEGAHPIVLDRLLKTNMEQTPGYGYDSYCQEAADIIKTMCGNESLAVHFLVGGTQTNLIAITAALRPHQCAIAPSSGHISTSETGAIEAAGHKIITVPEENGKITADQIRQVCDEYRNSESKVHITQPKLVFLTHATEYGTIYKRMELQAISDVCKENNLYLYIDGARLGYGLCAEDSDLDLPFIAKCCDMFYIGGTKQGLLFGEALIIKNEKISEDFRSIMKQRGGLLAKGRLLGLQFTALLENDLYFDLSRHANKMAQEIRNRLSQKGIRFFVENTTNQIFAIFPHEALEKFQQKYIFDVKNKAEGGSSIVRICTSWATVEENVQRLISCLQHEL
ncbi:amino acid lyase [Alphaproteobacteria bacterium]|nr:amino acid lyase [Alphaproteobacteria bacterium]